MDDPGSDAPSPPLGPRRGGPAAATVPGAPADASDAPLVELNALLGRGTRYSGKLHFDGRVRIEGRFEGEIRGEDVLVIGDGAEIDGDIEVGVCIVTGGVVRANIRARDAIELHAPATVVGDLHAPNVFIDRGVQFEGNCKMAPLDGEEGQPLTEQAAAATDRASALATTPVEDDEDSYAQRDAEASSEPRVTSEEATDWHGALDDRISGPDDEI